MKKKIALIYRVVLIILGIYGLYLNFSGLKSNPFELLHYFTILSNILVVMFFMFLIIRYGKNKDYPKLKGAVTMSITVTFLVFHFLLRPTMFNMIGTNYSLFSPANLLLHYIIPIMTIFDFLLFDTKGKYKKIDPIIWLIIPFCYFIIMSINGVLGYTFSTGSHYPYFFMDWDKLGPGVLLYVLAIIITFTILGYIYYIIDYLLSKNLNKN